MARWLVDGMNVIGSRPDGWWRDRPKAQRALVDRLAEFARAGAHDVAVVFDGKPHDIAEQASVAVYFAPHLGRDAADHDIVRRAEADPDRASLTVVTSDGDLAARVQTLGAAVTGAGSFRRLLDPE